MSVNVMCECVYVCSCPAVFLRTSVKTVKVRTCVQSEDVLACPHFFTRFKTFLFMVRVKVRFTSG